MQNNRLSERYGTHPPRFTLGKPSWWVTGVLAVIVALVAATAIYQTRTKITSKDVSFDLSTPGVAIVDFGVTKYPSATVECGVQVLAENRAIVGWKVVRIGPNSVDDPNTSAAGTTTNHRVSLRTVSGAVNGGVNSCWMIK